jgi:hypothetical protein
VCVAHFEADIAPFSIYFDILKDNQMQGHGLIGSENLRKEIILVLSQWL